MKKRNLLLVILAALLVFGMVVSCGPVEDEDTGEKIPVTLSSVSADGDATSTQTTKLTLVLSVSVTGLTASDIKITGSGGVTVTPGTLDSTGAPTYVLPIDYNKKGSISVSVSKTGYTVSGGSKTVTINDPFEKYYTVGDNPQTDKYYTEYTSGSGQNAKSVQESIILKKNKITFFDNERSTTNPDKIEFTVTKWEFVSTPSGVGTAYASNPGNTSAGSNPFNKGIQVTGIITAARPPDDANAPETTQVFGSVMCPGITKADITAKTSLYYKMYFDESSTNQLYFVKSSFYKTGATGQKDPIGANGTTARIFAEN